uniref:EOG090X07RL n=1 Tax=Alona affinis TaxID=381656 RepID=A0A9N6WP05_9CRUS|nr:EOG090X07RL [Alona affinis]
MAGKPSRLRGVLRHKLDSEASKDKFEDLLVFGYACKLFRDDEKAASIDEGSLLIPWMGDDTIKIDRYDARGTLFDLKSLEIPTGGYDRYEGLTAEERRIERLCDEERYFALYKDEAEEAVIKEEEIKRLNQDLTDVTSEEKSYHQVPFSYGENQQQQKSISQSSSSNEAPVKSMIGELGDAVYVPPPLLDVPSDMVVPPTRKLARIIEKTANFISSQGAQMEIIVKAKQASNPMFLFLHFDCELHPFYRHILAAIRNGVYVVPAEDEEAVPDSNEKQQDETNGQGNASEDSDSESSYLHPSLQPKVPEEPEPPAQPAPTTCTVSSMFPPTDARPLVDKTASYMAKNGRHLEAVVLSKGDARFAFLNEAHTFHPYYVHKLTIYAEMLRNQQSALLLAAQQKLQPMPARSQAATAAAVAISSDPDAVKSDRRKRAALFLDKMKRDRDAVSAASERADRDDYGDGESESTRSSLVKSKSRSPDDVEILDTPASARRNSSRERSVQSRSLTPSPPRKMARRSTSRGRLRTRSRSRVRSVSRTRRRSRSRSRSRSRHRRSPSPERRRRHRKKHRSRDRHRREKKKRRSRERSRKKSRRHRTPRRSLSRSPSDSDSPSGSSRSRSRSPEDDEPSRCSPITSAVRKLAAVQPAFNKIAEGIRAKVIAMIEADSKK